jgi:hypothetical protein
MHEQHGKKNGQKGKRPSTVRLIRETDKMEKEKKGKRQSTMRRIMGTNKMREKIKKRGDKIIDNEAHNGIGPNGKRRKYKRKEKDHRQ